MMVRTNAPLPSALVAFVSIAWLGMVAGVSFLATPVKFQATSLDLPVALEVGRVTFALFSKVEWAAATMLAISVLLPAAPRPARLLAVAVISILAVETLWLLPALDTRVERIIAGQPLPQTSHHFLYAAAEAAKSMLLSIIAMHALWRLGWLNTGTPAEDAPCD